MSEKNFLWMLKVLRNFVAASPAMAILSTISALVSKVSMILAFLLPMKVVILLSSQEVPNYFSPIEDKIGWEGLIISLGVFSGILFIVHILSSKVSEVCTFSGYKILEKRNSKLIIFEGQDDFMHGTYKRMSSMLSSIAFIVLSSLFYGFFYKEILVFLVAIMGCSALYFIKFFQYKDEGKRATADFNKALNLIHGGAFFGVFSYVLFDMLYYNPPSFIVILVSIIAFRIILGNVISVIRDIRFLITQKNKIDAVYFRDKIFLDSEKKGVSGVWWLLNKRNLDSWLPGILEGATGRTWNDFQVQWRQSGVPDILFLLVEDTSSKERCLVKVYHKKHRKKAQHEASLLLYFSEGLPAPSLLLATSLHGHHIHVMDFDGIDECSNGLEISPRDFQLTLMGVSLPDEIMDQYRRSHPLASALLREPDFSKLKLSMESREIERVSELQDNYSGMCDLMSELPLMLISPVKKEWVVKKKDNTYLLIEWGGWKLEQGAAGWLAKESFLTELAEKFPRLYEKRESLRKVSAEEIQFSCLFHEFCMAMKSQRFQDVVNMLPKLLGMYEKACHAKEVTVHAS